MNIFNLNDSDSELRISYNQGDNGVLYYNFDTCFCKCVLAIDCKSNREVLTTIINFVEKLNKVRCGYGENIMREIMGALPRVLMNILDNEFPVDENCQPLQLSITKTTSVDSEIIDQEHGVREINQEELLKLLSEELQNYDMTNNQQDNNDVVQTSTVVTCEQN